MRKKTNTLKRKKFDLLKECFPKFPFIFFIRNLEGELKKYSSVLDVGCGELSPLRFVNTFMCGVDLNPYSLAKAKKQGTHNEYKLFDIRKLREHFSPKTYDAVVALSVIEHLTKSEGRSLLKDMELIARKKVIVFTPNGFHFQPDEILLNTHKSGWETKEMIMYGYKVFGEFGPKILRGERHKLRSRPEIFWGVISQVFQWLYVRLHPESAVALLCIKELDGKST